MGQEGRAGVFENMRRFVTGAALLGIGCALGLVLGTVSNVPELLLTWAARDSATVDLSAPAPAPDAPANVAELQEFPRLQEPAKSAPPRAAPAPAALPPARNPQVASPPPAAAPPAAPAPPAAAPAAAPEPAPTPAAAAAPAAKDAVVASLAKKSSPPANGSVVQVAAYADARSAEALARRLRAQGLDSYVSDRKPEGQLRYRVRVRPAPGEDPKQLAAKLGQSGLSVWVTRE